MRLRLLLTTAAAICAAMPATAAITFSGALQVPNGTDFTTEFGTGVNGNRLGGFGSELVYSNGVYYGLTDRGPGGGLLTYAPRIQTFTLDVNKQTGAVSNFKNTGTIVFRQADGVTPFTGRNPGLNGDKSTLGASFDPEGLVRRSNGNFLVSDEYGPSLYEFDSSGTFIRAFDPPANLIPREAGGTRNYVDGRGTITTGRQDNRGYEGLTLSPSDPNLAYAILQDPLVQEGRGGQGRRGQYLRIVEYNLTTGATRQFAYQLEGIATINDRTATDFVENDQGRSIGVSSIQALPDGRFVVVERDNRGLGVDPANAFTESGTKRVYLIDINGATDISDIAITNGILPGGVVTVNKQATPFLDLIAEIGGAATVAEKIEGLSFGDVLADGGRSVLLITDNDFSVTQIGGDTQFDVCTNGTSLENVALDAPCSAGFAPIPTYIYAFKLSADEARAYGFSTAVPEPATWAQMIAGFGILGGAARLRRRRNGLVKA